MTVATGSYWPVIYSVFPRNHGEGGFTSIASDLVRIAGLGVDYVWLMPFYPTGAVSRKGSLGSPYAVRDYRSTDPALGSLADLVDLVDAAHRHGVGVLLDIVFNHVSPDSVIAVDHPEWLWRDNRGNPGPRVADWSDVWDLDYSHPELRVYQIETMAFWLNLGVDGFRCDVPNLVPAYFWAEARDVLDPSYGHTLWLAESADRSFERYLDALGIPSGSEADLFESFDLCYDYGTYDDLRRLHRDEIDLTLYLQAQAAQFRRTPPGRAHAHFLENHDHERSAAFIPRTKLAAWFAFTMFLPGAALIYAGQEMGFVSTPGLFEPDPVPLAENRGSSPVTPDFVRELTALRRSVGQRAVTVILRPESCLTIEWGEGRKSLLVLDLGGGGGGQKYVSSLIRQGTGHPRVHELSPGVHLAQVSGTSGT